MKKVLFTARQLLIGLFLLQLINLSLCTEPYWIYYNYSSANTYDPTETIVEWVVEWNMGLCKNFAWHVDIQHSLSLPLTDCLPASPPPLERITAAPPSACIEILSPPPEI
jgi:hypothetical protein